MDAMQKQLSEMKNLVKGLKNKIDSDGESDWLLPRGKPVAANKVGSSRFKIKSKSNTKYVFLKSSSKLD